MFILGIDPGLEGALALYDTRSSTLVAGAKPAAAVWDMPKTSFRKVGEKKRVDPLALANLVRGIQETVKGEPLQVVVEKVHSLPRQAGGFNFGLDTGTVHGVLGACGLEFFQISPAVWKVAMGLQRGADESKAEAKSRSRALATQLFPEMAQWFKRVGDDGRAEALLLAVYFANRDKRP